MTFRILAIEAELAEEDPRNAAELGALDQDLRKEGMEIKHDTSAGHGKGLGSDLIVLLSSSTTVTGMVAAFRAWVNRPARDREIKAEIDGHHFRIDPRSVESAELRLFVKLRSTMPLPVEAAMSEGRFRAILIGNWTFGSGFTSLNGPPIDIARMRKSLCDPDRGLHLADDVTDLSDESSVVIRDQLAEFFSVSRPDDQLLVYYSGHGYNQGLTPQLRLLANDSDMGQKGWLHSRTVGLAYVNELIAETRAKRTVLVLDCCYSGSAFSSLGKGASVADRAEQAKQLKGQLQADLRKPQKGHGLFALAACRASEEADDATLPGEPSPFTAGLVQALETFPEIRTAM